MTMFICRTELVIICSDNCLLPVRHGWGLWSFLMWWSPSTKWADTTGSVYIIPSFGIGDYMLHVEHISCIITNCGQHQWFISLTLSVALSALREEKYYHKIIIPIFRLVLQHFALSGCFLYILFYCYIFSCWLGCYCRMWLFKSGNQLSIRGIINWRNCHFQWQVNLTGALTVLLFFSIFLLLLPVYCVLSIWGNITIPMYRLWLHGLYGLHGHRYPPSEQGRQT